MVFSSGDWSLARKSSAWLADEAIDIGRTLRQHFRHEVSLRRLLDVLERRLVRDGPTD